MGRQVATAPGSVPTCTNVAWFDLALRIEAVTDPGFCKNVTWFR